MSQAFARNRFSWAISPSGLNDLRNNRDVTLRSSSFLGLSRPTNWREPLSRLVVNVFYIEPVDSGELENDRVVDRALGKNSTTQSRVLFMTRDCNFVHGHGAFWTPDDDLIFGILTAADRETPRRRFAKRSPRDGADPGAFRWRARTGSTRKPDKRRIGEMPFDVSAGDIYELRPGSITLPARAAVSTLRSVYGDVLSYSMTKKKK